LKQYQHFDACYCGGSRTGWKQKARGPKSVILFDYTAFADRLFRTMRIEKNQRSCAMMLNGHDRIALGPERTGFFSYQQLRTEVRCL